MANPSADNVDSHHSASMKKNLKNFSLRRLRQSLKYRPDILKKFLRMRQCIKLKNRLLISLKQKIKSMEKKSVEMKHSFTQTENNVSSGKDMVLDRNNTKKSSEVSEDLKVNVSSSEETSKLVETDKLKEQAGWDINQDDEKKMSIADQVKEVAQNALQQTGMVYVESAGMYYDYKTGYYYNSELGLYYHTDTECYYYYSDDKQNFVFHSYPDRRAAAANAALKLHEKKKAKKHKKDKEEDGSNQEHKPKRRKTTKKKKVTDSKKTLNHKNDPENDKNSNKEDQSRDVNAKEEASKLIKVDNNETDENNTPEDGAVVKDLEELEDGECSESGGEKSVVEESDVEEAQSEASTSTESDDETVAKHHPPCMRVIVKETSLPKLKVGSLYLVTKDGGTVGREGDHHAILLRDTNVSRNHLEIRYDLALRGYVMMDLGSKNGTILNGTRLSESQVVSKPVEVMHGSVLQLGETKLLCHIHPGKDTCGHCEPGLLMETQEKEKQAAYTRTCSVQKQHYLELARLKNKYAPQPPAIEETAYNDRAQIRREKVGSSHHAEKTQSADLDTFIAPENKGFKLLEKMGWSKGEGLGKDSQGDTEPNHLEIRYDLALRGYVMMDLGSKNGTILNGTRLSESQVVSKPVEVMHGSVLQLGETKLLCHIHPGKDTCGHCEPGLLMETQEKEKQAAYTRTCSVQKQHYLELARLKNKYAPQPPAIEETAYNDRAQIRREKVGSSHHAEKTQSADLDTFIAPENKGFKLLEKMGWSKGEGLGKDSQGDTEPIPIVNNEGKSGLGASGDAPAAPAAKSTLGPATMRLLNKTKMLKPPARVFQKDDELDSE